MKTFQNLIPEILQDSPNHYRMAQKSFLNWLIDYIKTYIL